MKSNLSRLLPGLVLCVAVTLVAAALQAIETRLVGEPYLEALVLAILLGVGIRIVWTPGPRWTPVSASAPRSCSRSPWCCWARPSAPLLSWRSALC